MLGGLSHRVVTPTAHSHLVLLGLLAFTPLVRSECGWSDGVWVATTQDYSWTPLDPACTPKGENQAGTILLIGDSVERFTVEDFCGTAEASMAWTVLDGPIIAASQVDTDLLTCTIGQLVLAFMHIPGVHPTGPWFMGDVNASTPLFKATAAINFLSGQLGRNPDLVVLSSNFWDVSRVNTHSSATLQRPFDAAFIQQWMADAEALFDAVDELVPKAVKVLHTTALPALVDCNGGNHVHKHLGSRMHVTQLNMAMRRLAGRLSWHLIDLEEMLNGFWPPSVYVRDAHHPKPWVLLTVVDMYLAILEHHN